MSEPVAWINRDEKEGWLNWDKNTNIPINIPLYTHPVELTDEEMYELLEKYQGIELCKAVLRKASEK